LALASRFPLHSTIPSTHSLTTLNMALNPTDSNPNLTIYQHKFHLPQFPLCFSFSSPSVTYIVGSAGVESIAKYTLCTAALGTSALKIIDITFFF
jgi:hypothetical protein